MLSSTPSVPISIPASKTRSITRLSYSVPLRTIPRTAIPSLQRRHYADEPAPQSEPEADGATEAQHGDNSIAASADADASSSTPAEKAEESAAASTAESATEKATEQVSSTADSVKSAVQSASEAATGAAQSLGAAAGFGSQTSRAGKEQGGGETSKNVYVGNLFFDVKSEDLKKEFERAGPVVDAKIITDQRGLSKGFVTPPSLPSLPQLSRQMNAYASQRRLLTVSITDSATSISKPSKPPPEPSNCTISKTSKAAVLAFNTRLPVPVAAPLIAELFTRTIAQRTLLPKPCS